MSAANAAAIRRRANIQTPPAVSMPNSQTKTNTTTQPNSQKPTLTQFINTLDQRIKSLEENTNNISSGFDSKIIDEYNTRFEILANEIGELKDIILKLQSFTMEVNKSLYDDRIHIMSEIPPPPVSNETNNFINQLNNEKNDECESLENKIMELNTSSADIKTMVEEEISA
jgi:hypothetical protein